MKVTKFLLHRCILDKIGRSLRLCLNLRNIPAVLVCQVTSGVAFFGKKLWNCFQAFSFYVTYFRVGISRTKKKEEKKRKHRKVPFAENLSLSKFILYTPADSFACYACYGNSTLLIFTFPSVHLAFSSHRSLNREGRWGTKDDFVTSFLHFFPVLHCLLGLAELQDCPFPDVVFPPLPSCITVL